MQGPAEVLALQTVVWAVPVLAHLQTVNVTHPVSSTRTVVETSPRYAQVE